jgi:hypothetical protein
MFFGIGMILKLVTWTVFLAALTKALSALHTSITTNVLLFMVALIVLYVLGKYFAYKSSKGAPVVVTDLSNVPPDYAEYLKYQALARKYERTEPVTVQKFLVGFTQGKNWAKALALGIMMVVLLGVGVAVYKEVRGFFVKPPPVVSTITNTGSGTVEAKTESKTEQKQSNGLNLNFFSGWF